MATESLARMAALQHGHLSRLAALKNRLALIKGKGEEHLGTLLTVGEVAAAAYACGVAKGRFGPWQVLGLPGDGAAGAAVIIASLAGVFGKHADHATALGAGALASYAVTMGAAHGAAMGQKKPSAVSGVGALPGPTSTELDELIDASARAVA